VSLTFRILPADSKAAPFRALGTAFEHTPRYQFRDEPPAARRAAPMRARR
jgi:hypothetical protein